MKKHFMIFVLCAAFLLSLTACGKQETEEAEGTAAVEDKDYVYLPEFIEFGNGYYSTMLFEGNSLYYNLSEYDEEAEYYRDKIYEYSLEDGSQKEVPMQIAEIRSISHFARDKDGNSYAVLCDYGRGEILEDGTRKADLFLNKYDSQGNMVLEKDITGIVEQYRETDYSFVDYLVVDDQENLYLGVSNTVLLFSAEGEERGAIEVSTSWISGLKTGKNGKVYISYNDNSSNGEMVLSEIDFQKKKIGNTYKNVPRMNGDGLTVGITKDFLVNDSSKVYEYDLSTQTYEEILTWADCDVLGTNIRTVGVTENGTIMAVLRDWEAGTTELVKFTEADPSEVTKEKEEIVIAVLYDEQSLQEAVVAFNKGNDKYRATIKTYMPDNHWDTDTYNAAVTRLQNDIISNTNRPDIVNLTEIDEAAYIEKGAFEDLYPYLDGSSVLSREDFFESILEGCTFDGKLMYIPDTFYINTVVGKTSVVGGEMGWTLDDLIALAGEYPDASCFDGMENGTVLYNCMLYNQDLFMDWEKGECYFDTDEFKRLLEFCNQFPSTIDWQTYTGEPDVEDLKSDRVLLQTLYIGNIPDLQLSAARFGDEVTFIGFPTADGSVGCGLVARTKYGIIAKSPNKDGAWAFLESFLTRPSDGIGSSSWSLPALKSKFEAMDFVEGKNWAIGSVTTADGSGWTYTYHKPTEEEIDQVKELIAVGKTNGTLDSDVTAIILIEADAYFTGQKSIDEVADIIQNRVQLYMSEKSVN